MTSKSLKPSNVDSPKSMADMAHSGGNESRPYDIEDKDYSQLFVTSEDLAN